MCTALRRPAPLHGNVCPPWAVCAYGDRPPPRWTLLVDDDSYVNVAHLLRLARRFDAEQPLLLGHVLDGVWRGVRSLSGGAGMLLSRAALARFGDALASGTMPLPPRGVPNDQHIVRWATRLGVRCVHSNSFAYGALPADAYLVARAGASAGRDIDDYVGGPTRNVNAGDGQARRAGFALAAFARGALDAQVLGVVVVHRVPQEMMEALHARYHTRLAE